MDGAGYKLNLKVARNTEMANTGGSRAYGGGGGAERGTCPTFTNDIIWGLSMFSCPYEAF